MKGFLLDENLPGNYTFLPLLPVTHVSEIGQRLTDSQIWEYAIKNDLAIVSKDADFSDRIIVRNPPPRVIHLRFGNMRRGQFHSFLAGVWPRVETLIKSHKLVNVYLDRIESIA